MTYVTFTPRNSTNERHREADKTHEQGKKGLATQRGTGESDRSIFAWCTMGQIEIPLVLYQFPFNLNW